MHRVSNLFLFIPTISQEKWSPEKNKHYMYRVSNLFFVYIHDIKLDTSRTCFFIRWNILITYIQPRSYRVSNLI